MVCSYSPPPPPDNQFLPNPFFKGFTNNGLISFSPEAAHFQNEMDTYLTALIPKCSDKVI